MSQTACVFRSGAAMLLLIVSLSGCSPSKESCQTGSEGCSCTAGGGCDPGLTCVDDVCVDTGCPAGTLGCPCTPEGGCDPGLECSGDVCMSTACSQEPSLITGPLMTHLSEITFDSATVTIFHKRDVDEYEDGCIALVEISLTTGGGCVLHLIASSPRSAQGGLSIATLEFSADSFCPGFSDLDEGLYNNPLGMTWYDVVLDVWEAPGYNVAESCISSGITIRLEGPLLREDGLELTIGHTEIVLTGEFKTFGHTDLTCPCIPDCGTAVCGDDGCGGSCGTCPEGHECRDGACVCVPNCGTAVCGDDGCGSTCGTCPDGLDCVAGACVDTACTATWWPETGGTVDFQGSCQPTGTLCGLTGRTLEGSEQGTCLSGYDCCIGRGACELASYNGAGHCAMTCYAFEIGIMLGCMTSDYCCFPRP